MASDSATLDKPKRQIKRGRHLLTSLEIKHSTKPKLRDGDGLWLHTSKAGGRYWVFIYVRHGKRREMGLGPFGSGTGSVSLAAARTKADEVRAILGRNGDPFVEMEERKARMPIETFGRVADDYVEGKQAEWAKPTIARWKRAVEQYAKPLRKLPIGEITTDDVLKVLTPIWNEKHETAKKLRNSIELVLDYAKVRGLRTGDNPARWSGHLEHTTLSPQKAVTANHPAIPYQEIPGLIQKLRTAKGIGAKALEFTILTAARSGETRGATWDEFDLDKKVWTVPPERMKERREHRVPLSDRAVQILRDMESIRQFDIVFPGANPKRPMSDMTLAKALKSAGVTDYVVHGMRSTFSTWASEETDHLQPIVEAALAHASGDKVERAYRRGDRLEKRRALMNEWAAFCEGEGTNG